MRNKKNIGFNKRRMSVKENRNRKLSIKEGASFYVDVKFDDIDVTNIKKLYVDSYDDGVFTLKGEVNITLNNTTASSYYYGTPDSLDGVNAVITEIVYDDSYYNAYDPDNMTDADIKDMLYDAIAELPDYIYTGKYDSSSNDGTIRDINDNDSVSITITDSDVMDYFYNTAKGDTQYTNYYVYGDGEPTDDIFEEKSDAVEKAMEYYDNEEYDEVSVRLMVDQEFYNGDIDTMYSETVWSM